MKIYSKKVKKREEKFLALNNLWKSGYPYMNSRYIRKVHSFFMMITNFKKQNLLTRNAQIGDFVVFRQFIFPEEDIIFTFLTLAKDV